MITRNLRKIAVLAASLAAVGSAFGANVVVSRTLSANTTWTSDNTYILEGYTFVTNNATLTIEPGTVIKGRVSTGSAAASLVITRGSKIMADGTADSPIIFTSELDNLDGNLGIDSTGLWGGVIILGNATINSRANGQPAGTPAEDQVEGLSVSGSEVDFATFGGTNDADNSGVFRYVSIRHGGAVIGGDNEINGLTMGGVGSGTTIEFVEVFANKDDSFEWFGGTVNGRYLVSAFGNDDSFDFDQGYRGSLQHLFSIQSDITSDRGDKGLEWDGATSPLDASPKGDVTISNLTAIGVGPSGRDNTAVNIRDNVTAKLYNSVFMNFTKMLDIENDIGEVLPDIKSNVWFSHIAANNTAAGLNARPTGNVDISGYFTTAANNNSIVDPALKSVSYTAGSAQLDPRPASTESPIWTLTRQDVSGAGLTNTDYVGAFGNTLWIRGWTNLDILGYFPVDLGGGETGSITEDTVVDIVRGSSSKAVNLSSRSDVTSSSAITAGFVIGGSQNQTVLIRAIGPSLAAFGVTGALSNVQVELFLPGADTPLVSSQVVTTQSTTLSAELGAFALTPGAEDATIVAVLPPGSYTAVVTGVDGATGNALVEIYELD